MENGHHARVLIGSYTSCFEHIPEASREGADTDVLVTDQFSIENARHLAQQASSKPITEPVRTFIIACSQLTHEAQNALLKLFEDPPASAQFYLIIPRLSVLLPTLRSRVQVVHVDAAELAPSEAVALFLAADYAARIEQIAALQKAKDTAGMRALIEGVERAVATASPREPSHTRAAVLASTYRDIRGASHKLLLEHLALSLPSPYRV